MKTIAIFFWAVLLLAPACANHGKAQPKNSDNPDDEEYEMLNDEDIGVSKIESEGIVLSNGDTFYIRTNCTGIDDEKKIKCDVYYPLDTIIVAGSCKWVEVKCRAYAGESLQSNELCGGYIECRAK